MPRIGDDAGFTLVELLVAILLAAVIGGVAVGGLAQGLRAATVAQQRIDAFNELQLASERIARELRAADPVLADLTADQLTLQVQRDGRCNEFAVRLTAADELFLDRRRSITASCDASSLGPIASQRLVTDVTGGSDDGVFKFAPGTRMLAYAANDGTPTVVAGDVRAIRLTLQRALPRQDPVVVSTVVSVRNAR